MSDRKKNIIDLLRENPTLALVYALLVGITVVSGVVGRLYAVTAADKQRIIEEANRLRIGRDSVIRKCQEDLVYWQNRYISEIKASNDEVKSMYERQLQMRRALESSLNRTKQTVNQTKIQIEQISDED